MESSFEGLAKTDVTELLFKMESDTPEIRNLSETSD
jgi:hypothetical protein